MSLTEVVSTWNVCALQAPAWVYVRYESVNLVQSNMALLPRMVSWEGILPAQLQSGGLLIDINNNSKKRKKRRTTNGCLHPSMKDSSILYFVLHPEIWLQYTEQKCKNKNSNCGSWIVGSAVKNTCCSYRIWFPAPTWRLATIYNSSSRRSTPSDRWGHQTCMWYTHGHIK